MLTDDKNYQGGYDETEDPADFIDIKEVLANV